MNHELITVLLAESQHTDYLLIQELLAQTRGPKFQLRWVQEFAAAEDAMATAEYDCCLLDERLGTEDALDLLYRTLIVRPDAPIVVVGQQDDYERDVEVMRAGGVDYLARPSLSPELLERSIRRAIEWKRIQAALQRRSVERHYLATAIENLSVAVIISDPNQTDNPLIFANPAFTIITGYSANEVIGRNCRFLTHPNAEPSIVQAMRDAIREKRFFKGVLLNRRKDGTPFRNSLIISPVFDSRGTLMNFVGVSEDVTAQFAIEEALRQSERRYESIVANVPGMIYRVLVRLDGTPVYLYVSEGCRELLGLEPEAIMSNAMTFINMIHPEDAERLANSVDFSKEPEQWSWQGRVVLATGEEKVIEGVSTPDVQANGERVFDGVMTDVTARTIAEQKVAQLAAIVASSADAIKSKTLEGIITSWNAAATSMYGYTADEMVGGTGIRMLPDDRPQEEYDLLKIIARGESIKTYDTVRVAKDGTLIDVSLTMSPIRDSAGRVTGASTIALDNRQRKLAEAQIERHIMRIQALRNIDLAITGSLDLRVTLNVLLDQLTTQLRVDSATVLRYNPHTSCLEYSIGRGFRTTGIQQTNLRIGEGIVGRAASEGRLMSIADLSSAGADFVRASLIENEGFVTYWVAPLITKGRLTGVLELFNRTPITADDEWVSFLETLAGQAAIAIENAELFDDLQQSNVNLQIAYDSTLEGWSKALDLRDRETEGHTLRVTEGTMILARAMSAPDEDLIQFRRGALLHDIGKMGIPDAILLKPGPLTDDEWAIMKQHPVYAYEMLSPIQYLHGALDIPYCHHEKWDGSGYPRGLRGEQIPLSARIFAVVDVWDALCSDRPYRAGWPEQQVRDHIAISSGSHFDPRVAEIFLNTEISGR